MTILQEVLEENLTKALFKLELTILLARSIPIVCQSMLTANIHRSCVTINVIKDFHRHCHL